MCALSRSSYLSPCHLMGNGLPIRSGRMKGARARASKCQSEPVYMDGTLELISGSLTQKRARQEISPEARAAIFYLFGRRMDTILLFSQIETAGSKQSSGYGM